MSAKIQRFKRKVEGGLGVDMLWGEARKSETFILFSCYFSDEGKCDATFESVTNMVDVALQIFESKIGVVMMRLTWRTGGGAICAESKNWEKHISWKRAWFYVFIKEINNEYSLPQSSSEGCSYRCSMQWRTHKAKASVRTNNLDKCFRWAYNKMDVSMDKQKPKTKSRNPYIPVSKLGLNPVLDHNKRNNHDWGN